MKELILFLVVISNSFLHGQELQSLGNVDLYKNSLRLHVEFTKSIRPSIDTMYIRSASYFGGLDSIIGGVRIIVVDEGYIYRKTSKKRMLPISVINPLKIEEGEAVVYVVDYNVTRKRRKYTMSNVDRTKVKVVYNCEEDMINFIVIN